MIFQKADLATVLPPEKWRAFMDLEWMVVMVLWGIFEHTISRQ